MSIPQHVSWPLSYHPTETAHVAMVCFHRTSRGMRNLLTKRGHKDSVHTLACCWQAGKFDGKVVAEIHLSMEDPALRHIVHESLHASWHRVFLLGVKDDDWNQEEVAENTATLTCQIVGLVKKARGVLKRRKR